MTFEFAETNINGQERYMLRSYVPNRLASGEVVGIFVLIRDITERRNTAQALHQAYQHLEQRVRERTAELTSLNDQLLREIEERSQAESRLREAKREAEQANLSKTKFLAAVSHDLLQPLNAARLFTSALLERDEPQNAAHLVRNVSNSLEDVENLLGTLVDISKLDAGVIKADVAPFALHELMDNLAAEYVQVARSEGLELHFVGCSAVVRSDIQLLARILRNLLSNAIRYTPAGAWCWGVGACAVACGLKYGTAASALPKNTCKTCSWSSSGVMCSARTRTVGWVWAWQSWRRSPASSATGSACVHGWAKARCSLSRCR